MTKREGDAPSSCMQKKEGDVQDSSNMQKKEGDVSENARVINEGIDALQAAGEEHFINQAVQHFQANAAHSGTSPTRTSPRESPTWN